MKQFILSISCIIFFTIINILYFIANTNLYIKDKELQEKYKFEYIMTIIIQIILFIYLLWIVYHRINHQYLGFKSYNI
jgi:hypothetical protein